MGKAIPMTSRLLSLLFLESLCLLVLGCSSAQAPKSAAETPAEASPQTTSASTIGELAPGEPESPLPIDADDARLGSTSPRVTVVGFLDFQCPYCKSGFETLLSLARKYEGKDVRVVFKHLPLESHALALPAAIAGQAVVELAGSEAFFEFAEQTFEQQADLDFIKLASFAEKAGVTRSAYNEAVTDERTLARVARDARLAQALGVSSTPSFFINGRMISGAQEESLFVQYVDRELEIMSKVAEGERAFMYAQRVEENTRASLAQALLEEDPNTYRLPIDGSATLGPPDALVTLVAFSDYECPYCKRAEKTLTELRERYPEQLRFVFKHHPLPFHQTALPAARLAEAVRLKNGDADFFKLSEQLFAAEPPLDRQALSSLGRSFGLTSAELEALSGGVPAIEERIQRDGYLSDDVGASGTPHFFINGKRLAGARPLAHFEAIIDHELSQAQALVERGTAPSELYAKLQHDAIAPNAPRLVELPAGMSDAPARGPKDAPVTIHVFSDFQCPYCKHAEETLQGLEATFAGKLRFVWHNLPLSFHARAMPAARAAAEAYKQKGETGFWNMHDLLFGPASETPALETEDLLGYGRSLKMDIPALTRALDQESPEASIEADQALAESMGIRGTPAFIVGGYLVTGARAKAHFERVVRMALTRSAR